jgi:hypothetical protein
VARKGVVTTIKMGGPFFRKDPAKTFRQNVRVMMDAIAAEGEKDVKAQLEAGNARRLPIARLGDAHVSDHVVGRTKSLTGRRWAVTALVSANRPGLSRAQSISLRAAASSLETRGHAFRKTKNRIGRTRKTNMSELLKDIA